MKKSRFKISLISLKRSIERFPVTVVLSTGLALLLILFNEQSSSMTQVEMENFIRIIMTVGLGVLLSFCLGLFAEGFAQENHIKTGLLYSIGLILLIGYYLFLIPNFSFVPTSRYVGLILFLIISSFFIPWLNKKEYFEHYVIKVFSSMLVTFVYSGVLCFGLFAILFTLDQLFNLSVDGKYYYYIFLLVSLVFAVAMFLSKIPGKDDELEDYSFSRSLKVLLLYIVIPLISVYTLILYVYFSKILLMGEWPQGLVSHLVLWYSSVSVGVIFLISPLAEDNPVARLFKGIFPKVNIPILAMMFVSIGIRINQYGFTENRYYVVLLGLWVLGIMIYYAIVKKTKNIIVPITLAAISLIAVIGPLSGYSFSIRSQNNRFESLLVENGLYVDGALTPNPSTPRQAKKEINNIMDYFLRNHQLEDVELLPDDFTTDKAESLFGFSYTPYDQFGQPTYINYGINLSSGLPINIADYDYYVMVNTWYESTIRVEGLEAKYDKANGQLTISQDGRQLLTQNIHDFIYDIYLDNATEVTQKGMTDKIEDMTFKMENEDLKAKLIFTNFYGVTTEDPSEPIELDGIEMILFLRQK